MTEAEKLFLRIIHYRSARFRPATWLVSPRIIWQVHQDVHEWAKAMGTVPLVGRRGGILIAGVEVFAFD